MKSDRNFATFVIGPYAQRTVNWLCKLDLAQFRPTCHALYSIKACHRPAD